jgi:hypothetical protein
MPSHDTATQNMLTFCNELPAIPGDKREAESNARHMLHLFDQRQSEINAEIGRSGSDVASLRCESEALVAGRSVMLQLWQRRFGQALPSLEAKPV